MLTPIVRPTARVRDSSRGGGGAFTLIELLVVAGLIALLAALIVTGIMRVQALSMAAACMAREKAIGTVVKCYTSEWQGWTHPDGHHYPSLMGYPTYDPDDPDSFDEGLAGSVKDFRCPVAEEGSLRESTGTGGYISRGYLRSYSLASAFQGRNILGLSAPDRAVMIHERNQPRHPNGVKYGMNYLFANLTGKVTGGTMDDPEYLPGLMTNWFASVSLGSNGITTTGLPNLVMVWSEDLRRAPGQRLSFLPTVPPHWDYVGRADEPNWILGKWTGYLDFPAAGNWTIAIRCDEVGGVWIDANRDDRVQSAEYVQQGTRQSGDGSGQGWWLRPVEHVFRLPEPGKYRIFLYFFEWQGTESFSFWWENKEAGIARTVVPADRMWHNPFGNREPFNEPINFAVDPEEL